jgi:membrane protein
MQKGLGPGGRQPPTITMSHAPKPSRAADSSSWFTLKALPRICRQASSDWINDDTPRLGAAVAFYTLLSLAPLVVITVALAAIVYGQAAAEGRLAADIHGVAGPELAHAIQEIIKGGHQPKIGAIATLFGLATLAFGASSVFVELRDAMNTIWHVSFPSSGSRVATIIQLIRVRFYSFVTVLGTGFLLLVSLLLNAWIAAMRISVPGTVTSVILYLLVAAVFAALYRIVPDVELKWKDVALAAMITALLFVTGKELMGLYFAHAGFGSTYSAAGAPMVVLLWVYYSAQLFFWGAEFTKVYAQTVGSQRGRETGKG